MSEEKQNDLIWRQIEPVLAPTSPENSFWVSFEHYGIQFTRLFFGQKNNIQTVGVDILQPPP